MLSEIVGYIKQLGQKVARGDYPFITTFGGRGLGKAPDFNQDQLVAQYRSWVYACARQIAFNIAKANLKLYKVNNTNQGQQQDEIFMHPFFDLMRNVNPFFNQFELWTLTTIFLELTGNAYWWVVKDALGVPVELWNIPANWVKVVPSKMNFIEGYVVQGGGMTSPWPLPEEEVIHFKYPSPTSLFYGASPTLAAGFSVDLNNKIKSWGINFFENNATPVGILSTENKLGEDTYKRLRDSWNKRHKGTNNAGKMAILSSGLKYQQIGSNLDKMKFKDIDISIRNEILAVFGVPAAQLGLVEDVNRANAEALNYVFQDQTIYPKLKLIEEKLNEKLIPMYDPALRVRYDNPVPADKEYELKRSTENIRSGYSSIDDERLRNGEEPYELIETATPLISNAVVPAGVIAVEEEKAIKVKEMKARTAKKWEKFVLVTEAKERLFTKVMKRFFEAQHGEVMRNVNKLKIQKDVKVGFEANIIFNEAEQTEKLREISSPFVKESFVSGVKLGNLDLGIDQFDVLEPNILRAVDKRVGFFAGRVNEATVALIRTELRTALEAGETIEDIARRMDKIFDFSEKFRSTRVARTEVIGATNDGQLAAYLEAGVTEKEWVTALDEKVRSSHVSTEGQVVAVNETFVTGNGNQLLYPGDRSTGAPASDIVNCRCTVNPIIKGA